MRIDGLKNMGFNYPRRYARGCCAVCERILREMLLICADLYCCDGCGRVYWRHGDGELLREIGRREVITDDSQE